MAKPWPILALFLLFGIKSQSQKIFFEQLTTAEGLPSDYVNCVFEDSKGYLWIGTDKGAARYDGREFQYFSNDNGLPSNFISCFAEDPSGNIWIGTVDRGASLFDGKEIKLFSIPGHPNANIREIRFFPDGSFFITAERLHLFYFDGITATPRHFPQFSFIKKINDSLFLSGLYGQLHLFEKAGQKLVTHPYPEPSDKHDYLAWLSESNMIVLKDHLLQNFVIENRKWTKKNEFVLHIDLPTPAWLDLKKVLVNEQELFVATTKGLLYIDSNNQQFFFTSENGLGTNYIQSLFRDRQGVIYICTYGSGLKIWPAGYLAEMKTAGKVTSIFPAGIETYITTTNSVYRYKHSDKNIHEIYVPQALNYTAIHKSKKGTIYLGTLNNFYQFPAIAFDKNELTGDITKYSFSAGSGASGFAFRGSAIFISTYGNGNFLFNPEFNTYDTLDVETTTNQLIVESLVPLGSSIAALTYNSGITIYDSVNRKFVLSRKDGLLSNTVYSAYQEKPNSIWIGTKNGLNLFNGRKIVKTFSVNEGLIGTNVVSVFKDKAGRLWILSDKYLHVMDGDRLRAIRSHPVLFDEKNSINRAAYCSDSDKLFIGLTGALLTVDMDKIRPGTLVNLPQLAAVTKESASISYASNEVLNISHHHSGLGFRFANNITSFIHPHDIYYRLKGFDNNWHLVPVTNEIIYQKLPPGKYELLAKTINPDGYSSPETSLLLFEVFPPLWKRTWFILVMSLILLAIFFSIGHLLSKSRYKQRLRHLEQEYRLQLERERIARELHDNVGSQLTYLINKIDDDYPKLAAKNEAEKLSAVARGAMQELRETIWALDKKEVQWEDLHNKLRQLIFLYKTEKHLVELDWQVNSAPPLKPLEALNIYRIIQEALNNAEKYSGASVIKVVVLHRHNNIYVEIKDNGKGFDLQKTEKGYGLKNIGKRAEELNARIEIESEQGAGTCVKLEFR